MRDRATINAICWMIRNRRQVAAIPDQCGGEQGLIPAIKRACIEGQVAFDDETARQLSEEDYLNLIPDWDALAEIVRVFCIAEDSG